MSGARIHASDLADGLSRFLDRLVIDRTGGTEPVDVVVNFVPEAARLASKDADPGLSIFTAVQEQLGLRLVSGAAPVDGVVVVERVERPTPD